MVVTVYPGPGTSAHQSTQYSVTVNGSTAYVYGYSRTAKLDTQFWATGDSPYQSWVTWAADQTVTVVVTRLAGAITSCKVYPTEDGITKSIVGSTVTLTVPANRRLQVELNGNKRDWLWLFSSPPLTIPGGTTNWATYGPRTVSAISTGANTLTVASGHGLVANERVRFYTTGTFPTAVGGDLTEADFYYVVNPLTTTIQLSRTSGGSAIDITGAGSGTMQVYRTTAPSAPLYFPAGDHRVGRLFQLANGYPIYFDGSAHVYGTLCLQGCTAGSHVIGHGVLKCNVNTWEVVSAMPFEEAVTWSGFYGKDATYWRTNDLIGLTIVGCPFYTMGGDEFSIARNVQILNGWTANTDGFDLIQRVQAGGIAATINDCLSWCGDDAVRMDGDYLSLTVDNWYAVQSSASVVLIDYFGQPRFDNTFKRLTNIYARPLQQVDTYPANYFPTNAIVKAWSDADSSAYGAWDVEIDGLTVVGELLQPLFSLEVRDYPFATLGSLKGQIAFLTFRNFTVENTPPKLCRILGQNRFDTPHHIAFSNIVIGGVTLTTANFFEFFETNSYPYNITVEGQPVVTAVDLCNRALTAVGDAGVVTSISPPDNTKQAILCQRFYPQAVNEVLQLHPWGCATTRVTLTEVIGGGNDAWKYCYEIPAGMLAAIEMLPPGAPDDYRDQDGLKVPFRFERDADGVVRIYSNLENAILRYTVYETDPNKFDPLLQEGIVQRLAAKLVGPLRGGAEGDSATVRHLQLADEMIRRARQSDGNQRVVKTRPRVSFLDGRN